MLLKAKVFFFVTAADGAVLQQTQPRFVRHLEGCSAPTLPSGEMMPATCEISNSVGPHLQKQKELIEIHFNNVF